MNTKASILILLFVIFGVLFALSSCNEAGSGPPWPAFDEHTLTYDPISGVENREITAVSPKWNPPPLFANVSYTSADLPTGLTLDARTGVITGKPSTIIDVQTSTITATATGPYSGVVTATVSITITSNNLNTNNLNANSFRYPAIAVTVDTDIPEAESFAPTWTYALASPNDVEYSIPGDSPLPVGLFINADTGVIWGKPTTPVAKKTYTISATAKDGGVYSGDTTGTVSIIINAITLSEHSLSYAPIAVPVNIDIPKAQGFAPTWADEHAFPNNVKYSSTNLPEGLLLNQETGVIWGRPTAITEPRDYTITATAKDATSVYAGEVSASVSIAVLHSRNLANYGFKYDPADIPASVDAQVSASPEWTTALELPDAVSYSIENADGSTPARLPDGLSFNEETGVIKGTPKREVAERDYRITVKPKDGVAYIGNVTVTMSITVVAINDISGYTLSYPNPAEILNKISGVVGSPLSVPPSWDPTLTPGTTGISYKIDSPLPRGLEFDTRTGVISGKPTTTAAEQTYLITASGSGSYAGKRDVSVRITIFAKNDIAGPDYSLSYPELTTTPVGTEDVTIAATWKPVQPGAVTYSASPKLPAGLDFTTSGAITGTPTAAAEAKTYTVTATASGSHSGTLTTKEFTITISPIELAKGGRSFSYDDISIEVNRQIEGAGFLPKWTQELDYPDAVSYSIEPTLVPATSGLSFSTETGAITGTPNTAAEAQSYTVTATGTGNHRGTLSASFTIIRRMDVNTPTLSYKAISAVLDRELTGTAPPKWVPPLDDPTQVRYTITEGADPLPAGLELDPRSGVIRGTPTGNVAPAKDYSITVIGLEPYTGTREVPVNITITMDIGTYTFTYPLATGTLGDISATPLWDIVPAPTVRYEISPPLPDGLNLDSNTGLIEGTFAGLTHTSVYTVTATGTSTYTGTKTGVFLDAFVLPTEYTPTTTESSPISTLDDLKGMTASGTYHLTNHIDLGTESWTPLFSIGVPFTGTLHGNGYAIYNLNIAGLDTDNYQGLFAAIGSSASVKNLGIGVGAITGGAYIGALAGYAIGTLDNITGVAMSNTANITANGTVTISNYAGEYSNVGGLVGHLDTDSTLIGNSIGISVSSIGDSVGGLVGRSYGTVTGYATGAVIAVIDGGYVGGLVGWNHSGTVDGYATGDVSGTDNVGGLVGLNYDGTVTGYATGDVSGTDDNVGGLVGYNWLPGTVSGYATGSVSASDLDAGGLVGSNYGTTTGYATGAVIGGGYVGGLVGSNIGTVSGYATGPVIGIGSSDSRSLGGLVGSNYGTVTGYATGAVIAVIGSGYVGGLVGWNQSGSTVDGYATGAVIGGGYVGGVVGFNDGIATGYATGAVIGSSNSTSLGGLVGRIHRAVTATAGYWDQARTGQNSALGTDSDAATYGTFTGAGVSATKNIVYTAASSSYTDGTNTIFDVSSFKDAFDLTGPDAASATWPKLKPEFSVGENSVDFAITYDGNTKIPLVQPTVSDIDGQTDADGNYTIEVDMPTQEKFPEGWPFLN